MPFTINGIGTTTVPAGSATKSGDHDAIECFVVLFLPVIPIKPIHTFNWNGNRYQSIPLKWSLELVVRAFAGRWLIVPMVLGAFLLIMGFSDPPNSTTAAANLTGGAILVALGIGGLVGLHVSYGRQRRIREVLGGHQLGSSDPAKWDAQMGQSITTPNQAQGVPYSVAARELMAQARFPEAMWAARLAVLRENAQAGEQITDAILQDPRLRPS